MARVSKMKIVHAGETVENEAKEYPVGKVTTLAELDKIEFKNGKMVIIKGGENEKHTR